MRFLLLFCILFLSPLNNLIYAETLKLVTEIDILKLINNKYSSSKKINLYYSNRKKACSMLGFKPYQVIDSVLKVNSIKNLEDVIIRCETPNIVHSYTYYDFAKQNNKITPYILTTKTTIYNKSDTVMYYADNNTTTNTSVNFSELDKQLNHLQKVKIYLQISPLSKKISKKIFSSTLLVFPLDKNIVRWAKDLKKIKIYVIE